MIGSQPRTHPPIPCPSRRTTVRPACTWCTLAQDAALALDAAECTWNMVRPCTIIYLPTYLLIIETKHNLHARKKHCLSLSIFIYVQDMINFFAKDHAQCFHRAAAGGCGTKLRIVVVQGLRGAALLRWHPHVPWQGRWRFWDLEVLKELPIFDVVSTRKKRVNPSSWKSTEERFSDGPLQQIQVFDAGDHWTMSGVRMGTEVQPWAGQFGKEVQGAHWWLTPTLADVPHDVVAGPDAWWKLSAAFWGFFRDVHVPEEISIIRYLNLDNYVKCAMTIWRFSSEASGLHSDKFKVQHSPT